MKQKKEFYKQMKEKFPLINVVGSGLSDAESASIAKGKTPNKRGVRLGELIRDPKVISNVENNITKRTKNIYNQK